MDPIADDLLTIGTEAIGLIDVLPTSHSPEVSVGVATSLVLPGLLAKTRDDFQALLDLSTAGRTSASAVLSRVLLGTTVEFIYLTSGTRPQQEHRAVQFFAIAALDKMQQEVVEAAMKKRHAGGLYSEAASSSTRL